MIIINTNEKEKILHGLIKGKITYKIEERGSNTRPTPPKMSPEGMANPHQIVKGKFSCFLDKPLPTLKSE